ncbi:MAG: Ig-like domain-containing protein [Bacteriovoracaceae bacterium]|nr:Ig-like domain-containing protein [Bacteriovoracaceae bacterium]
MIKLLKYSLVLALIVVVSSCVQETTSDISPNLDQTQNPDFNGIGLNIITPVTSTIISKHIVVGGYCSNKDYPIKVTNSINAKTVYSICQSDFSWAAAFNADGFPTGNFSINAQIFDTTYSTSSNLETVAVQKGQSICTEANEAKLFANYQSGGDGVSTPYVICTPKQFSNMVFFADKKFVLGKNIDFANKLLQPIPATFKGELNGNGYRISNIIIKDVTGNDISVGIFKYIQNATIKNIEIKDVAVDGYQRVGILAGDWRGSGTLENVKISGHVSGVSYVGGIAGLANTMASLLFKNVKTEVEVSGTSFAGGALGFIVSSGGSFTMENSTIMSKVSGNDYIAGIIGKSQEENLTFTNTKHIGNISSQGRWVGGFAGETQAATFTNCENVGDVKTTKDAVDGFVGGLVGELRGLATVTNTTVSSNVESGSNYTGGFFGLAFSIIMSDSISRGSIYVNEDYYNSTAKYVGGLSGSIGLDSTITNSRSFMDINAKAYHTGGLVGTFNGDNSQLIDSFYSGNLIGYRSNIGGLVGTFRGNRIERSFSKGTITVESPTPYAFVGGIAGQTTNVLGVHQRNYSQVDIAANNGLADYVGGLYGYLSGASASESYYTGTISGVRSKVGGLAGFSNADISLSYSMGTLNTSWRYVGGLVGVTQNSNISDSFSLTTLYGIGEVGGLVGWLEGTSNSINKSYFVGSIHKLQGGSYPNSSFGQIYGEKAAGASISDVFYLDTNSMVDHNNVAFSGNASGSSLAHTQLRNEIYYTNYTWDASNWTKPETGFKLPALATDYLYASFSWLRDANLGFNLPDVFSDDPLQRQYASIFIKYDDTLDSLNQSQLNEVYSDSVVTNVTPGNLELTIESPSVNGLTVTGQTLVHGQCGIAGNPVVFAGDITISSICQDNNRWAAVVDVTPLAVGTINFNVSLKSLDYSQSSTLVAKNIIKADNLCEQPEADTGTFANSYQGADGDATPYKICHAGHFANIQYFPDKKFELVKDIDFAGNTIEHIKTTFSGELEGNNHTIKNFIINKPTKSRVGLFALANSATFKNLNIENAQVTGYNFVGGLVGSWSGTGLLDNVSINSNVTGVTYTGGAIGVAGSAVDITIQNSIFESTVTGNNYTGGVIGHISTLGGTFVANNLTLKNTVSGLSYVGGFLGSTVDQNLTLSNINQTGNVVGLKSAIGGIVGAVKGGSFTNLQVTGNITAPSNGIEVNAGGIIGLSDNYTINFNGGSYTGTISSGGDNIGGAIGRIRLGSLTNIQSHGQINTQDTALSSVRYNVGGIVGHATNHTSILDSFSDSDINAQSRYVGGLIGRHEGNTSAIRNSFFLGSIDAKVGHVGGLAGSFDGNIIEDSYNKGHIVVTNPTPNSYIGGIVGITSHNSLQVNRVYSEANITTSNGTADYAGGIVGRLSSGATISECYAISDINGPRLFVGGIAGMSEGNIEFCYAKGDLVASQSHIGGLVGYQLAGSISNSFSRANVSADVVVGGIVGLSNVATNAIEKVYSLGSVTKMDGATPLSAFGLISGVDISKTGIEIASSYALDTNYVTGYNNAVTQLISADLNQASSYVGFDFLSTKHWRSPAANYKLPTDSTDYEFPILEWISNGQTQQGYLVGGTVTGLNYSQVTLSLNSGAEEITILENQTSFQFSTQVFPGNLYEVTIITDNNSSGVECTIQNFMGTMGSANITNVELNCPTLDSITVSPGSPIIGNTQNVQLSVMGSLSNGVDLNLTDIVNWSSNNTSVSTIDSSGLLTATGNGTAIVTASIVGVSDTSSISVFDSISEATSLGWSQTSPHNSLTIDASWVKSISSNLSNQIVRLYESSNCSGSPINTFNLSTEQTLQITAEHNKTYSYDIDSLSVDGVLKTSGCSVAMNVVLDTPDGVTSLASSDVWVGGSSPINSPIVSWVNPSGINIDNIKVGLGSSFGATDIVSPVLVGNNNTHVFQNLSGLNECSPYFPVVTVVDEFGIESSPVVDTIGFRWDNTIPATLGTIAVNGDATPTSTGEFSWSAGSDNCAVRYYELAIGTSNSTQDVADYVAIGNITTFTAVSGLLGFNLNMQAATDYYTFVRAVDYAGNKSVAAVSAAWQVVDLESELPSLILWLDSEEKDTIEDPNGIFANAGGFNNKVKVWHDQSGSTNEHDFSALNSDGSPYFQNDKIFFNGTNHFFTTPNHAEINLATVSEKNISLAIKTDNNINDTQVIYEEGGTVRGMNIYISGGKLYCGFWNITDDGDGAQGFTSASVNINANSIYNVSWVFDYSNYAGPSGPDGSLDCYVNNQLIGSGTSTTRVFPHSGAIGIGGMYNDTYYHTGAASGNGDRFRGEILEVMITNESVDADLISTIHNYLYGKWSSENLSKPNNLTANNDSSSTKAAIATWQAIDPALFNTSSYEIALGTTPGGTEKVFWTDIGNVLTYQMENGVDGFSFSLADDIEYYISVRAVDSLGNYSSIASTNSWELFNFATDVQNKVLEYNFRTLASIEDENGVTADNGSFTGNVNKIYDLTTSNDTHDTSDNGNTLPIYDAVNEELIFDGSNNRVKIPNSNEINLQLIDQKNITIGFSTSGSTTAKQVIYEEGGGSRGMNIYIQDNKLYCGFWNIPNDGDGAQSFISVSEDISPSTRYVITWRFDYSNFTSASGADGKLDCFLNTEYMGSANTTTRIYPHGGGISLGASDGSYFHSGGNNNVSYFSGTISDVIINNTAMKSHQVQALHHMLGY